MPLPLRKQNCFLASTGGVGILDLRNLGGSNSKKICQMHPQPSLIQSANSSDPSLFSSLQSTSADSRGPNILLPVAYLSIPCMYAFLACQVNAWWFFCFCGSPEFENHSAIWNSTSFLMFLSSSLKEFSESPPIARLEGVKRSDWFGQGGEQVSETSSQIPI